VEFGQIAAVVVEEHDEHQVCMYVCVVCVCACVWQNFSSSWLCLRLLQMILSVVYDLTSLLAIISSS
jgi:hypothetical protein